MQWPVNARGTHENDQLLTPRWKMTLILGKRSENREDSPKPSPLNDDSDFRDLATHGHGRATTLQSMGRLCENRFIPAWTLTEGSVPVDAWLYVLGSRSEKTLFV